MDDLSWLLVATKPRAEAVAQQHLERQGFQVCLPQVTLRKRKQGKWQQVTEPMFPGYVFLGIVLGEQDTTPIRSTSGCRQLVRFGGRLVPAPAELIRQLMVHEKAPSDISRSLKKGQAVRIEAGPFASLEAVFEQSKGANRVELLLAVLGAARTVKVPASDIVAL